MRKVGNQDIAAHLSYCQEFLSQNTKLFIISNPALHLCCCRCCITELLIVGREADIMKTSLHRASHLQAKVLC